MRALKLLVIVMGALLVAGIVGLGFAVDYRVNHPRPPATVAVPAAPTASTLDLPEGARVAGAEASGDRLAIRVELGGGGEEVIVVDLRSGRPISTVILRPKASP